MALSEPRGIIDLTGQHVRIAGLALLIGLLVAVPIGMLLGHTGRGGAATVGLANISRAVPTLAILAIFAVTPIGFTIWAPVIALTAFAIPPILANTYVGFREVDRDVVEAARAMGMSERQVVFRAELPLAVPLMMTGIFAYFTAAGARIYLPGAPFLLSAALVIGGLFLFTASSTARKVS